MEDEWKLKYGSWKKGWKKKLNGQDEWKDEIKKVWKKKRLKLKRLKWKKSWNQKGWNQKGWNQLKKLNKILKKGWNQKGWREKVGIRRIGMEVEVGSQSGGWKRRLNGRLESKRMNQKGWNRKGWN